MSRIQVSTTQLCLFFWGSFFLILPLFFWPSGSVPFELPKVTLTLRWIEAFLVGTFFLAERFSRTSVMKQIRQGKVLFTLLGLLVLVIVLSAIFGVDLGRSMHGNYFRWDGITTMLHLFAFTIGLVILGQTKAYVQLSHWISAGALFTGLWSGWYAIALYVLHRPNVPHWSDGGIGAGFGQPNFLGGYLLVTLPFVWNSLYTLGVRAKLPRWGTWTVVGVGMLMQLVAIAAAQAYSGLVGVLVWLTIACCIRWRRLGWAVLMALSAGVVFLAGVITVQRDVFIAESRSRVFTKILLGVQQRPILGWGWANVDAAFKAVDWPFRIEHDVYVDKAHHVFLEYLAATGVVGLVTFIAVLGATYVVGTRLLKQGGVVSPAMVAYAPLFLTVFCLYLFHAQTNVTSIAEEVIFWFSVGVIWSFPTQTKKTNFPV